MVCWHVGNVLVRYETQALLFLVNIPSEQGENGEASTFLSRHIEEWLIFGW